MPYWQFDPVGIDGLISSGTYLANSGPSANLGAPHHGGEVAFCQLEEGDTFAGAGRKPYPLEIYWPATDPRDLLSDVPID